jgi:SAM-dependent methyltransferase
VGWSAVAGAYASTFAPLSGGTHGPVLAAAGVSGADPGVRVLDVGAGTGDLAAAALAAGAEVTAVDPDPDMLALTRERAPGARLGRAGLPLLPFADAAYDAVLANFVVNHVPDPRAAVNELARVAAPGGRVVVTIWPSGQNVQSRLWAAVIAESGAVPPPSLGLPADRDFPRTCAGLAALVAGAGLRDVEAQPVRWSHRTDPRALWRGAAAGVGGDESYLSSRPHPVK